MGNRSETPDIIFDPQKIDNKPFEKELHTRRKLEFTKEEEMRNLRWLLKRKFKPIQIKQPKTKNLNSETNN